MVHVSPHGALVDTEPVSQFGRRPDTARLQKL